MCVYVCSDHDIYMHKQKLLTQDFDTSIKHKIKYKRYISSECNGRPELFIHYLLSQNNSQAAAQVEVHSKKAQHMPHAMIDDRRA